MYRLMNAAAHCFIFILPFTVQDLLWPGVRREGKGFSCQGIRKPKGQLHSNGQGEQVKGSGEDVSKPTICQAPLLWGFGSQRFWAVWKNVDWHLCSPFLLQTFQKSLGLSKPFNQMDAIREHSEKLHYVGFSPGKRTTETLATIWGENCEEFEDLKISPVEGISKTIGLELPFNTGIEMEVLNPNGQQISACEMDPETMVKSIVCPELEFRQSVEENLTSMESGSDLSNAFELYDCPTDEDLSILCDYLGDPVDSSVVDFRHSMEENLWLSLEVEEGIERDPIGWPNLDYIDRSGAHEVGSGFTSFPRVECFGTENHFGQKTSDNEDQVNVLEGGSCSEDDYSRHNKFSGTATSGGENDGDELDQDWQPPDQDLIQKLIVQIEYYLSDENLEKDAFLLKHVRRNKMGFVSVKLLTSFKKVKHLTRDWRTTAYALRFSEVLELNEDSRKIRRKTPVPVFPSENLPSKMLLVYDLHFIPELQCLNKEQENGGMQEKIMEQLLKSFGVFGVISSIRILKPGRDLPSDVKRFSSRYSQVGTKDCAIVEFEEVEAAIKAHETLNAESDTDDGIKVILIGMKPPKKKLQKDRSKEEESKNMRKSRSLNKRVEELQYIGDEPPVYSSSEPDSNPNSPMVGRKIPSANKLSPSAYPNNHLSPNASPRSSPWSSPCGQRKAKHSPLADGMSPELSRKCTEYSSDSSITPSSSPWVQRRRQAQTVTQEKSPACSPMLGRKIQNADGLPLGVLRLPRGPDGTKGFHNGSERNKPIQDS